MVSAQMVPSKFLIEVIAEELRSNENIFQPPTWAEYVKTGVSRGNAPENRKDWWYTRVASVLRKIYIKGPIGVIHLKKLYGGRKNRGSRPERSESGSGAIIRLAIHQLEKAGYVTIANTSGRIVTPAGRSFVDKLAMKAKEEIPELANY
ncbi:MAG: 30S ribosomal protein S19e [Candidatus Heimdallarchaeota archaeon]|nr:30S ribosomal protein S19e [Candidatus Heimdallarchaeota archaeon]